MAKINSRKKGNRFELTLAKMLSEWWEPSVKDKDKKLKAIDLPFRRSPLSGAWDKKRACGDFIVPPNFPFFLEAKNREGWHFEQLWNEKNDLVKWYMKALQDYHEHIERHSHMSNVVARGVLMIFTKNRHPNYVMFGEEIFEFIGGKKFFGNVLFFYISNFLTLDSCSKIGIMRLEDFLKFDSALFKVNLLESVKHG